MNHTCQKHRFLPMLLLVLLTCLTWTLFLPGCGRPPALTSDDDNADFQRFTRQLFRNELASSTISLHYTLENPSDYGIDDVPVTYGNFTSDPAAAMASVENCLSALHQFQSSGLSDDNQLTYDVLDSYLRAASSGAEYLLYQEPLSPITGIHAQLPVLLSEYQLHTAEDASTYLELLSQTASYFDSIIDFEQKKAAADLFMPDYQAESVVKQCRSFVEMGGSNYLYTTFSERLETIPSLSDAERTSLSEENARQIQETIFPAYTHLADELEGMKGSGTNDKGLCYLPDGQEYYQYLILRESGISESVPALQKMTKEQIITDLQAMQSIGIISGSDTSAFSDNSAILESLTPSSILTDLKSKISGAFPDVPEVSTDIKYVPDAMEEYLSPAFYMIPAIDNTSENVIYINKGQTVNGMNLYTTLAHEGYPGHLYQTVYYAAKNPDPLRNILDFGGYVEGWATYAEMMSYYLAPITKNEATLLQKNSSALLGLYALADMGIHYDGWSLMDTAAFFKTYGISDLAVIRNIYELIVGVPGNYLKYYLGYLKFLDLKKEIAAELGNDFSQIEFHRAVLDAGPVPFDILEQQVRSRLLP